MEYLHLSYAVGLLEVYSVEEVTPMSFCSRTRCDRCEVLVAEDLVRFSHSRIDESGVFPAYKCKDVEMCEYNRRNQHRNPSLLSA